MSTQRELFEATNKIPYLTEFSEILCRYVTKNTELTDRETQDRWEGWQKAINANNIDIPHYKQRITELEAELESENKWASEYAAKALKLEDDKADYVAKALKAEAEAKALDYANSQLIVKVAGFEAALKELIYQAEMCEGFGRIPTVHIDRADEALNNNKGETS